ncbi:hypothetical protein GL213_10605 [Halogeometricum borinquense]|uniref:Uncharacterized protein n=1 Tax=Halogeometricum borinquense TaxID=60847 RepID=A0A6C0UE79_9EURY|nr:hypothetical protein [Halogeometricum borinquense]QIB73714.1 hypothetical protein G3I44_05075 [Halogeometricum borinquense]QIQ76930.1 hypothetical protein GL213_10605 [Halogeometricum borinquense]
MDADPDLVAADLSESIRAACRTAVGDTLRSITYFTPTSFQQLYLRSDLESDADLAGFVEHETDGFHATRAYRGSELGDYQYTIRAFENGYMTRVTRNDHGVFVTTDSLTERRSKEVASALHEILSEQVSEAA